MTKTQAEAAARQIVEEADACEYCRLEPATDAHEITRGPLKKLSRGKRSCTLALCRACHNKMGGMSWAKQLMILYTARKDDSNVLEVWNIAGRRYPTIEELIEEAMKFGSARAIRYERKDGE
jgi:hypothetical protein